MKKRTMKKFIPRNTPYCYVIKNIEMGENGLPVMKCDYCKNFYRGATIDDTITGADGIQHPVKYRKLMCRYIDDELIYEDAKLCGIGY